MHSCKYKNNKNNNNNDEHNNLQQLVRAVVAADCDVNRNNECDIICMPKPLSK